MPESLTPVTQHLAVWDVQRDAGWVALYGEGSRPLTPDRDRRQGRFRRNR